MLFTSDRRVASVLAALMAVGCSAPVGSHSLDATRTDAMKFVQLDAQIEPSFYDTGAVDQVRIHFNIVNDGATPIAVLGVAAGESQSLTEPNYEITAEGDLSISHGIARASGSTLAGQRATYAHQLLSQDSYENTLTVKLLARYPNLTDSRNSSVQPKRIRYCAGVAPFESDKFIPVGNSKSVWRAQANVANDQYPLCSQWFDVASR